MNPRALISLLLLVPALLASAWSSKGHQVTAYIAKRHLSAAAQRQLDYLLDGSSIVYYASWLDTASRQPEWEYTSTWHYINVNEWEDYEHRQSLAYTDAVTALYEQLEVLGDENCSKEERAFAAKVVVHVVGDLHQPLHAGHSTDLGGNYIRLKFMGESTNLHSLWDYYLVEALFDWNYYEWAVNIDTLDAEDEQEIQQGTIDDWARESVERAAMVYRESPAGAKLGQEYANMFEATVTECLERGGLRLSRLLNEAFDNSASLTLPQAEALGDVEVYNTQGVRVARAASIAEAMANLPAGIYIVDGRKVLKR